MIGFILLIFLFILFAAFFSGMETAMVSCSRIRIRHLAESGSKRARTVQKLLSTPEKVLATTLVGTNIGVISASSLVTYLFIHSSHTRNPEALSTLIMVPILLVFGDILPKAFFYRQADILVLWFAGVLKGFFTVLAPVVSLTSWPANLLLKLSRKPEDVGKASISREELQLLVTEGQRDGAVTPQEARLIRRTFDFGHIRVRDIMIPIRSVVSLDIDSSAGQAVATITRSGYSRIPVFDRKHSHLMGLVVATDLLGVKANTPIKSLLRPIATVSPTTRLESLLIEMQENQCPLMIVVNKKNIPVGIVTLEDVVEKIVGEIKDEFDG